MAVFAGNAAAERVMLLGGGEAVAGKWRFSNGAEFPGATGGFSIDANGVGHLKFDFTGGGAYVGAYCDPGEPAFVKGVSFRIKKPAEMKVTVRVTDSKGQTFQKSVVYERTVWQGLEFGMRGWTEHWGGANDGILEQPVRTIGFLINTGGGGGAGEVLLSDVSCETASQEQLETIQSNEVAAEYLVTDFADGAGFRADGSGRLSAGVWEIDFAEGSSARLSHSLSLLGQPEKLVLKLDCDRAGYVLKMRLGSHFQGFEKTIGVLKGGSESFEIPLPPAEGWTHSGGENDGKVRYPLRLTGITLERADGAREMAVIKLGELRCVTRTSPDKAVTLVGGIEPVRQFGNRRMIKAVCKGWNMMDKALLGDLIVRVYDWQEKMLFESTTGWVMPGGGMSVEWSRTITVPADLNFVEARFSFAGIEGMQSEAFGTYTRPADDKGDPAKKPELPWGMGVYLYRYADNPEGYERMDRAAAMAQAAGVKWSREEFSWSRIETRPGEYDFHFYDKVVETAERHGICVYGLLSYWSQWTKPYTQEGFDDFSRYAAALVKRYKERIRHWEIYNEPNIFFWKGPRELYPDLVKKCYAAIKEADPEAQVLAISTAGIDRKFIRMCLDAGAPFDGLTIHPYRSLLSEKSFIEELKATAEMVGNRPMWITEMGWSTQIGGVSERDQAQLLARCYLSAAASGVCRNVSWYDFRCDGDDQFYNEDNFGVLRNDLSPKPAYRALMTVCRTLNSGIAKRRSDFGENVYGLQMGEAVALWTHTDTVEVLLKESGIKKLVNLMGEELALRRSEKGVVVRLEPGRVVFVLGSAEPAGQPVLCEETGSHEIIRF